MVKVNSKGNKQSRNHPKKQRRKPKIGDIIYINNPYAHQKYILKSNRKLGEYLIGTIGRITKIYEDKENPYVIEILKINPNVYKVSTGFEGSIWNRKEFRIMTKKEAFMELL